MPWMPVPRFGMLMDICYQFLNKPPAIPIGVHGPAKVLMVLVKAGHERRDAVHDRR